MTYLSSLLFSLLGTIILLTPLRRFSVVLKLVDMPNARKVHAQGIPRIGGIAMVPAWLLGAIFWVPDSPFKTGLLGAVAILFVFCVLDDRYELHYAMKLLGQLVSSVIFVKFGEVSILALPFLPFDLLPVFVSELLTVIVIVAVINAMNLIDGLDGLAGGTAMIVFCVVAILAYQANDAGLVIVCISAIGSLIGFLRYNGHPAQIFMGDTGSQFLGLIAVSSSLYLTQKADLSLSPLFPLLLLSVPVVDTCLVFAKRLYLGHSPFRADKRHIHHRLLDLGLSHLQVVIVFYIFQLAIACGAFLLGHQHDALLLGYFLLVTAMLAYISSIQKQAVLRELVVRIRGYSRSSGAILSPGILRRFSFLSLNIAVAGVLLVFVAGVSIYSSIQSRDVALLCAVLFLVSAGNSLFLRHGKYYYLEKPINYIAATVVVFCAMKLPLDHPWVSRLLFLGLSSGFLLVLFLNPFTGSRYFRLTPTDLLLISAVPVVSTISILNEAPLYVGRHISELIMLFFMIEYLSESHFFRKSTLRHVQSLVFFTLSLGLFF
ncbi:MAG: undecaprenyl/decaprenyl-phosphate alpha-N-acetylglucosaminyl 1-phosphate transferase [Gammaproteobacteria bacterium]|nr:undecaprenyl/decaprenyl-phosphate alpha-N-acetylglucosaminyl 1-phosphate transferase [Gammaproteobacteria bacterium]MBQ0840671.1 undecaprenyl/decaprenyl-phosphate alpha-N-acetylglucosaminyl 1-phosphate transferase [Gammaproteobacteria bacterium]